LGPGSSHDRGVLGVLAQPRRRSARRGGTRGGHIDLPSTPRHHIFEERRDVVPVGVLRMADVSPVVVARLERVVLHRYQVEGHIIEACLACRHHQAPVRVGAPAIPARGGAHARTAACPRHGRVRNVFMHAARQFLRRAGRAAPRGGRQTAGSGGADCLGAWVRLLFIIGLLRPGRGDELGLEGRLPHGKGPAWRASDRQPPTYPSSPPSTMSVPYVADLIVLMR
jgi:hypothetical protein